VRGGGCLVYLVLEPGRHIVYLTTATVVQHFLPKRLAPLKPWLQGLPGQQLTRLVLRPLANRDTGNRPGDNLSVCVFGGVLDV
jgi:hypothetical protein